MWDTDPLFTNTGNITAGLAGIATTVSGLLSNTLYYFKLVPSNGTVAGGEQRFIRNHKIQNNVGCGDAYRRVEYIFDMGRVVFVGFGSGDFEQQVYHKID
jgi:hypothetical protein